MPSHAVTSLLTKPKAYPGAHASTWPLSVADVPSLTVVRREYFGGKGRIVATTKVKALPTDLPVRRRVRLIHELSGMCVAETWSRASDGEYRFEGIALGIRWTVLAYDHTETHRAVSADRLYAEPMP